MKKPDVAPPRAAVLAFAVFRIAGAVALAALAASGAQLAREHGPGGLGILAPDDTGSAWALHRSGAVLLILASVGGLLLAWPLRRPRSGLAALAEGGPVALAAVRAHLGACLTAALAMVIASGSLLTADLGGAPWPVAALHGGAGFLLLSLGGAIAALALAGPSRSG